MHKIPTLLERNPGTFKVVDKVKEDCLWVVAGQGIATEKLDGTNVRLTVRLATVVRIEKRRNPDKGQKKLGILDGWYTDVDPRDSSNRWIVEAVNRTSYLEWSDGEHCCEALGPKIQGNPLGLEEHVCIPFNLAPPVVLDAPRHFEGLRTFLETMDSVFSPGHLAEGIVFHHMDGRRAKIKRKDFA